METELIVRSDKEHTPKCWVENENEKTLFESDNIIETIQWAIDHVDSKQPCNIRIKGINIQELQSSGEK